MKIIKNKNYRERNGLLSLFIRFLGVDIAVLLRNSFSFLKNTGIRRERLNRLKQWDYQTLIKDKEYWYKAFKRSIITSNDKAAFIMMEAFYNCIPDKVRDHEIEENDILIVCVEKNELIRMNKFLEHYRKIGGHVKFLIVDNDSDDGIFEMLKEQPDVILYTVKETYNSKRKTAWTNYVIAEAGLHRWYLVVDSDEFLEYEEMENLPLSEYVKELQQKKMIAVKAVMLEMYPKGIIGSKEIAIDHFREEYIYYDEADSYSYDPDINQVGGGFLERVFGEVNAIRTKVPLFYVSDNRFMLGSHHIYPLYDDIKAPFELILQHYKFLPGDEGHIREAVRTGVYANGSRLYKKYIKLFEGETGISVYCEKSHKWEGKNSVKEFKNSIKGENR